MTNLQLFSLTLTATLPLACSGKKKPDVTEVYCEAFSSVKSGVATDFEYADSFLRSESCWLAIANIKEASARCASLGVVQQVFVRLDDKNVSSVEMPILDIDKCMLGDHWVMAVEACENGDQTGIVGRSVGKASTSIRAALASGRGPCK